MANKSKYNFEQVERKFDIISDSEGADKVLLGDGTYGDSPEKEKVAEIEDKLNTEIEKTDEHINDDFVHITEDERTKLSNIEDGANKYVLLSAGSSLGGVKSGGDVTIADGIITVDDNSHSHVIGNVDGLQDSLDTKVPTTRTVNGKVLSADVTISASDVGADASGTASTTVSNHNVSTDAHNDIRLLIEALQTEVNTKAKASDLTTHTSNTDVHITSTERTNWNDANNKKHEHSNKSILDTITQNLVDGWNSAVTHISDAVKHITADERTAWNNKSDSNHTHNYAGSSSVGGSAITAEALTTSAGSTTNPVYFSSGKPVEIDRNLFVSATYTDSKTITIKVKNKGSYYGSDILRGLIYLNHSSYGVIIIPFRVSTDNSEAFLYKAWMGPGSVSITSIKFTYNNSGGDNTITLVFDSDIQSTCTIYASAAIPSYKPEIYSAFL